MFTRHNCLLLVLGAAAVVIYLPILASYLPASSEHENPSVEEDRSHCAKVCALREGDKIQPYERRTPVAQQQSHTTVSTISPSDQIKEDALRRYPFEHFVAECSVDFLMLPKELKQYLKQTNPSNVTCSPQVFRQYMASHGRMYPGGAWIDDDDSWKTGPKDMSLYPECCNFRENTDGVINCMERNRWQKILITGDQNGKLAYMKFLNIIKLNGMECTLTEEILEDGRHSYLDVAGMKAPVTGQGCANCTNTIHICTAASYTVEVQYISTATLWDKDISTNSSSDVSRSSSLQEYLLQHYFPAKGTPNLWIMLPSLDQHNVDFSVIKYEFSRLSQAVDNHLAADSKLLLLSHPRFCHNIDPAFTMAYVHEHSMSLNEAHHVGNQLLFDAFRDQLLAEHSRVLAFLDFMQILCPFACHWNEGSTELSGQFYRKLMGYMLDWMC